MQKCIDGNNEGMLLKNIVFCEAKTEMAERVTVFLGLKDPSFWDYEYNSYLPDQAVFTLACADGQLVGSQALMPYYLNVNESIALTGRSERTLLHETYRGSGNFKALMDNCIHLGQSRGMALVWGFTFVKKAFERVGFSYFTGFLEHAIRVVGYKEAIKDVFGERDMKKLLTKLLAIVVSPILSLIGLLRRTVFSNEGKVVVLEKELNAKDISKLYSRIKGRADLVTIEQDESFIAWAYEKSNRRYQRYYGYVDNELSAYFVVDVSEEKEIFVVDFAAVDFRAFYTVWQTILKQFRQRGTAFIRVAYNHKNPLLAKASRWFMSVGFVPFLRRGGFVVRNICCKDSGILYDISAWYITLLWIALYRQ